MSVYLIRWANGTITFVDAASKKDAIYRADEFGGFDEETCHIERVKDFMLDFDVKFDGEIEPDVDSSVDPVDRSFPGYSVGGYLDGPIGISDYCMEQIDQQVFACKPAKDAEKAEAETRISHDVDATDRLAENVVEFIRH